MSEQPGAARPPRIDWTYEEIVLVGALVVDNDWQPLDRRSDPRVTELSELLRRMSPEHAAANPRFRNPGGVGRKTHDLTSSRPGHDESPSNGGRTTAAVAKAFNDDPERMQCEADAIRASALELNDDQALPVVDLDQDATFDEGRPLERRHLARERDPKARRDKIKHARRTLGYVRCEACGFDFEATYGSRGRDYIECHHRDPLSVSGRRSTVLADLALLCSNCHRMIHSQRPWITVEQLAQLVLELRE